MLCGAPEQTDIPAPEYISITGEGAGVCGAPEQTDIPAPEGAPEEEGC